MADTVKAWEWQCQECQRECVPIRAESRCMCGHRLKEHTEGHSCSNWSCNCPKFSFIVAEGSWILRCRCKHKHTEHDPTSHACKKAACSCSGFSSPWVCNCDHPWSQHQQVLVERQVLRLGDMIAQAHQAGSSSSFGQPLPGEVAPAAAAPAGGGVTTTLPEMNISSSSPAASAAAAAGAGAAGAVGDLDGLAAEFGAHRSSRLSDSASRLQQLQQQRRRQQQVPDAALDNAAGLQGMAAATADAGATAATVPDLNGVALLLAQGDLTCEVNRWDLVQRGTCKE